MIDSISCQIITIANYTAKLKVWLGVVFCGSGSVSKLPGIITQLICPPTGYCTHPLCYQPLAKHAASYNLEKYRLGNFSSSSEGTSIPGPPSCHSTLLCVRLSLCWMVSSAIPAFPLPPGHASSFNPRKSQLKPRPHLLIGCGSREETNGPLIQMKGSLPVVTAAGPYYSYLSDFSLTSSRPPSLSAPECAGQPSLHIPHFTEFLILAELYHSELQPHT